MLNAPLDIVAALSGSKRCSVCGGELSDSSANGGESATRKVKVKAKKKQDNWVKPAQSKIFSKIPHKTERFTQNFNS